MTVDRSVPSPQNGTVRVELLFGSVEVVGWDTQHVRVRGTIPSVADGLDVDSDDEGVSIEIDIPDGWLTTKGDQADLRSDLTIHVPLASHVDVETLNASVAVRDVRGNVKVESINGPIEVLGSDEIHDIDIESMTGSVLVDAPAAVVGVESIAGKVEIRGARDSVSVESVSGEVRISGGPFREVVVETTSGSIDLDGAVAPQGSVGIETFSGNVGLSLPAAVKARFEIATFSGDIENDFGPAAAPDDDFDPHKELHFSTGLGGAEIAIETFSGSIRLRKGGVAANESVHKPGR